jgi:hypothetical protein
VGDGVAVVVVVVVGDVVEVGDEVALAPAVDIAVVPGAVWVTLELGVGSARAVEGTSPCTVSTAPVTTRQGRTRPAR